MNLALRIDTRTAGRGSTTVEVPGAGLSLDVGIGMGLVSGGLTGESGGPLMAGELTREGKVPLEVGAGNGGINVGVVERPGVTAGVGAAAGAALAPGEKVPLDAMIRPRGYST